MGMLVGISVPSGWAAHLSSYLGMLTSLSAAKSGFVPTPSPLTRPPASSWPQLSPATQCPGHGKAAVPMGAWSRHLVFHGARRALELKIQLTCCTRARSGLGYQQQPRRVL